MRLLSALRSPLLFALLLLRNDGSVLPVSADPSGAGGLYPPGLLPIINRANILLSTGQFGEAVRAYSEAIEQSPTDYLLYYKRATAYMSLQRHPNALEDFDKVLSLTSNTFDSAHLQKARIYMKEGLFSSARHSLSTYLKAKSTSSSPNYHGREAEVEALEKDIMEGDQLREKVEKERRAQLYAACVDTAGLALKVASHSVEIRTWRAECALASGDIESAVGDLTRLSHLLPSSTTLLTHIFRLSYFLLPHPSPSSLSTLKQCLHYDPDSKPCLTLRRFVKKLDKGFAQLEELLGKEDWKGVLKLLVAGGKTGGNLYDQWEQALEDNVGEHTEDKVLPLVPVNLVHSASTAHEDPEVKKGKKSKPMPPIHLPNAKKHSPQRQHLLRALCKSYIHLADVAPSSTTYASGRAKYCAELLNILPEDVDGLVGKGETLLATPATAGGGDTEDGGSKLEEAVRVLEQAFEKSGRSDRDVHRRLEKAMARLKRSKQKDYYKILGVDRAADDKTIKKAFRKAAKLAHPDKGGSEAKMAALNEAYEVISNPELRSRFDAGEDPMDPAANNG
ncbi:hypothetical protein H1R20_g1514, partial [Candolleomyces eurysporus]